MAETVTAERQIRALVRRYDLPAGSPARLNTMLRALATNPLAPTTVRDPVRVVEDHFADSLVALEVEQLRSASAIADLGAGAGFPGLPLAIALPSTAVSLVDSSIRKCSFIEHQVKSTGIPNARVIRTRVESWQAGSCSFDVVTARALAPLAVVAEYAAPLLVLGGLLVVWRGRRDRNAESAGAIAAAELGLEVGEPRRVTPYPRAEHRYLHLMVKVRDTPTRFPRRPGAAHKRPLGNIAPSGRAPRASGTQGDAPDSSDRPPR